MSDRTVEVGQVWENGYGERFRVERVEELPAEQGYAVGHWSSIGGLRWVRDELRFNTLLGGGFELVEEADHVR